LQRAVLIVDGDDEDGSIWLDAGWMRCDWMMKMKKKIQPTTRTQKVAGTMMYNRE